MIQEMDNSFLDLLVKTTENKETLLTFEREGYYLVDPFNLYFYNRPFNLNKQLVHLKPKIVTVLLGVKCNLHCSYCIQTDIRSKVNLDFSPKEINNFIEKFKKLDLSEIQRITFWGGEPLVYWKTLQLLLPKLRELCPNLVDFYLSTNGTLLTKDKLDFLLTNNVSIQLSDDIVNTDRNVDLTQARELFNWAKQKYPKAKLSIHVCFSKENCDALKLLEEAEKIYKGDFIIRACPVSPPLEQGSFDISPILFDKNSLLLLEESSYQAYLKDSPLRFIIFETKLNQFLRGNPGPSYACRFGSGLEICIDNKGNIFGCRGSFNYSNIIGSLDDYPLKDTFKYISVNEREQCSKCIFKNMCKGICSQLPNEQVQKYCLPHYAFQRGIFRAILKILYNLELLSINNTQDALFQHKLSYETLKESKVSDNKTTIYLRKSND